MRDKLVHDYNKVDLDLTWEVTQSSITLSSSGGN
ncbi:MAG: DUF86 domain-containing protein [Microcystis aeruginosa W13-11]|nr:DUF86 domain-containing protein [Microcystis aeruginosa W13-11]